MILRRVIDHFRKQEWTAIALDFVIVVIGVFVGLQVSNWNGARADRAREATFLAGVADDIGGDVAEIDEIIRVSTLRMSAMNFLLERAQGSPLPKGFQSARGFIAVEPAPSYREDDPNTIGVALFILTTLNGNRFTYETMINTGGIAVIRDRAVLRAIQAYYANVDKFMHFETQLEENRLKLVDAQQAAGLSPIDLTPAAELSERYRDNPALLAAAKNYWLFTNRHLKLLRELKGEAQALIAQIAREGSS